MLRPLPAPTAERREDAEESADVPDRDDEDEDEDVDSAGAERAGAELARPSTAPAPSAAANRPTRPTSPAADMAWSIDVCQTDARRMLVGKAVIGAIA